MAVLNRRRRRRQKQKSTLSRGLVDRQNPLEFMEPEELFMRFRFRAESILFIVSLVCEKLERRSNRSSPLPVLTQVLVALRFLATGSFYSLIADSYSIISTSSVFRSVRDVCSCLIEHLRHFVCMPTGQDADKIKKMFFQIAGFPNVLGCLDGTFIRIIAPSRNEVDYLNRKGFHSLNVQMICDANYKFSNCVVKWPGSVHDSRIFRDSKISVAFENGTYKGFLLGDSGYPCKSYLMTPFLTTSCRAEERYNRSHCRTRVLVEQSFGILKRRFSCLHSGLRTTPQNACKIITACVILHNIGIDRKDIINVDHDDIDTNNNVIVHVADEWTGSNVRKNLCQQFFS
ncbi:putative nuclease HARBI1 [Haliotis cracherodii]|uniref:putative nuclease HARBI1 n=1 Tax=Haliotis cracherodii TaxID=6455 RepID=UPI0039E94965